MNGSDDRRATVRPLVDGDLPAVTALNAANMPAVGPLDDDRIRLFRAEATWWVGVLAGRLVATFVGMREGSDYASPNYRWFSERYDDFLYVDRIALVSEARGQGWGPALYALFESMAVDRGVPVMAAEVNTVPRNDRSLRFHDIAGFVEVGRCQPYGGDEEVAMLVKMLG